MTSRKRNEFLDIPSSEDEASGDEGGYDSEAVEETKGRSMKRRRVVPEEEEEEEDDDDLEESEDDKEPDDEEGRSESEKGKKKTAISTNDDNDRIKDKKKTDTIIAATTTKGKDEEPKENENDKKKEAKEKAQDKKHTKHKKNKKGKTGVIYLSSLPPYLKPSALKSILESQGFKPITRVFLTPETPTNSGPRRRSNKRKTYTDGWIEFASKKTAKICAETLNASIIGGKKGGWYHDDVWNMKYLRGFKWMDLMEQVQRERAERDATRRIEDSRARKEDKLFVSGVEKGRVLDGMQRKRESKKNTDGGGDREQDHLRVKRLFRQNEVKVHDDNDGEGNIQLADDTKRVLGKIF